MNIYQETRFLMKKYNITANKSLGQNFLVDEQIIENIIHSAKITKEDFVIEIGPGLGTLTSELVEKAGEVLAIELDKKMINILEERFLLYSNFKLIQADILKVDLTQLIEEENLEKRTIKIVANLPYYITTPIIMKLLEEKLKIDSITVMVQKEVADRLTAIPGQKNTGAITYSVYYYSSPIEVLRVPSTSFIPEPKVDSSVIQLKIRNTPPVELTDEALFFKIIKASFMQRRKTLVNGLESAGLATKEKTRSILEKLNLPENVRGETLSIEQFAEIANLLSFSN